MEINKSSIKLLLIGCVIYVFFVYFGGIIFLNQDFVKEYWIVKHTNITFYNNVYADDYEDDYEDDDYEDDYENDYYENDHNKKTDDRNKSNVIITEQKILDNVQNNFIKEVNPELNNIETNVTKTSINLVVPILNKTENEEINRIQQTSTQTKINTNNNQLKAVDNNSTKNTSLTNNFKFISKDKLFVNSKYVKLVTSVDSNISSDINKLKAYKDFSNILRDKIFISKQYLIHVTDNSLSSQIQKKIQLITEFKKMVDNKVNMLDLSNK